MGSRHSWGKQGKAAAKDVPRALLLSVLHVGAVFRVNSALQ